MKKIFKKIKNVIKKCSEVIINFFAPNHKYKKKKAKFNWLKFLGRTHYVRLLISVILIDLAVLLVTGFNFEKLFVWGINLVLTIPLVFLTIYYIGLATANLIAHNGVEDYKIKAENSSVRARCNEAPPGAGKTSEAISAAYILAQKADKELTYLYWYYLSKDDKKLSPSQLTQKKAVVEAYEYYQRENTIPCLWSNITLKDEQGRKSNRLTIAHLLQIEKIPYKSVLVWDEISNDFPARVSKEALEPLADHAKFIRHYYDGYLIYTEQDSKNAFIDVRRNTGEVRYYIMQEWFLKPKFLFKVFEYLQFKNTQELVKASKYQFGSKPYLKLINKSKFKSKLFANLMNTLKRYMNYIGYRKYYYTLSGTQTSSVTEASVKDVNKGYVKSFYLPSCLMVQYDERYFRNKYLAKDKEFTASKFNAMYLVEQDLVEREMQIKQFKLNAKLEKEMQRIELNEAIKKERKKMKK